MHKDNRRAIAAGVALAVLLGAPQVALAANPLGIGAGEQVLPSTGMFSGLMGWINQQQQDFYRLMSGALREMRDNPAAALTLVGLSFAYGVLHAAGPGHGKAVISSYMLANEVALRRGVVLSFASAVLQGITAIVVIGAVFVFLRGTTIKMGDATDALEIASYALITVFGMWLLLRKLKTMVPAFSGPQLATATAAHHHDQDHSHHTHDRHHSHAHRDGEVCSNCGHAHMPSPGALSGDRFGLRDAWSAVLAVGLRPCSGALIVLTFAFLNGLWWGGIASVFAMALGTAITVSGLATLAVTAKNVAVHFSGGGVIGTRVQNAIEIGGALLVLLLGLTLLTAALSA